MSNFYNCGKYQTPTEVYSVCETLNHCFFFIIMSLGATEVACSAITQIILSQ